MLPSRTGARFYVGVSGFSPLAWQRAGFSLRPIRPPDLLAEYAARFTLAELEAAHLRAAAAAGDQGPFLGAPPGFVFAVQPPPALLLAPRAPAWDTAVRDFRRHLAPLHRARKLAAVVIGLPPGFDRCLTRRAGLAALTRALAPLPLAMEFRHESWARAKVLRDLEARRISLVTTDGPVSRPGCPSVWDALTNPLLAYIRVPARQEKGPRSGYGYTRRQMAAWLDRRLAPLAGQARRVMVCFTEPGGGQALHSALLLGELLLKKGFDLAAPARHAPPPPSPRPPGETGLAAELIG